MTSVNIDDEYNDLYDFREKLKKLYKLTLEIKASAPSDDTAYDMGGILDEIDDVEGAVTKELERIEDEEARADNRRYGSYEEQNRLRMKDVL